jgi:hypothetical protein
MKKIIFAFFVGMLAFSFSSSAKSSHTFEIKTIVSDTAALKEFVGKYTFEGLPFDHMEISLKDGVLNIQAGEQGGPMKQDSAIPEVFDIAGEAKIKFIRNDEKIVSKIVVEYQGMVLEGKKEKL